MFVCLCVHVSVYARMCMYMNVSMHDCGTIVIFHVLIPDILESTLFGDDKIRKYHSLPCKKRQTYKSLHLKAKYNVFLRMIYINEL